MIIFNNAKEVEIKCTWCNMTIKEQPGYFYAVRWLDSKGDLKFAHFCCFDHMESWRKRHITDEDWFGTIDKLPRVQWCVFYWKLPHWRQGGWDLGWEVPAKERIPRKYHDQLIFLSDE